MILPQFFNYIPSTNEFEVYFVRVICVNRYST